jgi:hypothetical protein
VTVASSASEAGGVFSASRELRSTRTPAASSGPEARAGIGHRDVEHEAPPDASLGAGTPPPAADAIVRTACRRL